MVMMMTIIVIITMCIITIFIYSYFDCYYCNYYYYLLLLLLGLISTLRLAKQKGFPGCYDYLMEPTVFEVEAFNPEQVITRTFLIVDYDEYDDDDDCIDNDQHKIDKTPLYTSN
jgi:hypothetical protein